MLRLLKPFVIATLVFGALTLFFMGLIKVPLRPSSPPPPPTSPPATAQAMRPHPSRPEPPLEPLPNASEELTCLEKFVTVNSGGRLANQLFEYASAWAVGHTFQMQVTVPRSLMKYVAAVYKDLSATVLEDELKRGACAGTKLTVDKVMEHAALVHYLPMSKYVQRARLSRQPVVLRRYLVLGENIIPVFSDLRKEFTLRDEFVKTTQETLAYVYKKMKEEFGMKEVVLVGVHVRRTDYKEYLRIKFGVQAPAGVDYYRRAAALMRSYFISNNTDTALAFVVASDDPEWCESTLIPLLKMDAEGTSPPSSVFLGSRGHHMHPGHDLALLSSCHNSIIGYGTYGIWTAVMAGGRTIVYDIRNSNNPNTTAKTTAMHFCDLLPTWVPIS